MNIDKFEEFMHRLRVAFPSYDELGWNMYPGGYELFLEQNIKFYEKQGKIAQSLLEELRKIREG